MQNSPARSGLDVGSVIADTYTIEALIGRGGMGAVFLASHNRLPGKKVAIKVLHAEMTGEEVLARFKREAEIASRLGHPNIVAVHDFNLMDDGTPYLVLEYLHGESLAQRLRQGPLAIEPALSIVRQVGSALAAAHREGIVHRDLKPQNIFLVPTEVDGRIVEIAKVLDFGISKIRGSQTVKTQDSALLGTPQYMAPEQATGQHKHVDERTDVFAFGAIVYEMLSGQPAFSGETIPEVVFKVVYEPPTPLAQLASSVPESITAAVHRAMAKQAAERFPNVGDFVEAVTGQPLAPLRTGGVSIPPPDLGFAAGSRMPNTNKDTGKDAFAQTMGSGDHAPAMQSLGTDATVSAGPGARLPTQLGTGAPPSSTAGAPLTRTSAAAGVAATQAPASTHAPSAAATQAPAQATQGASTAAAAPPRRRTGLLIASVIGGAAVAAVATFMLTREPTSLKPASSDSDKPTPTEVAEPATAPEEHNAAATRSTDEPEPAAKTDKVAQADKLAPEAAKAANADKPAPDAPAAKAGTLASDAGTKADKSATDTSTHGSADKLAADAGTQAKTDKLAVDAASQAAKPTKLATDTTKPDAKTAKAGATQPKADAKADHAAASDDADDDDAAAGDPLSAKKLSDAQRAIEASSWDRAEQLANAVRTSEDSTPRQKLRATLLYGIVQCIARNDEGRARVAMRKLAGAPKLRRRLIETCKSAGYLQNER